MPVLLPVADGSEVCGVCVFTCGVDETAAIMNEDPAVAAGMLTYQVHPCGGFAGDRLP